MMLAAISGQLNYFQNAIARVFRPKVVSGKRKSLYGIFSKLILGLENFGKIRNKLSSEWEKKWTM